MIDKDDIIRLDERYVLKDDCNKTTADTTERITKTELTVVQIGTKLNIIIGILAVIGTAIVGVAINGFFGG